MSKAKKEMEKSYFDSIDALADGHAKEILKAIIHGNIGRLVGISEAIKMTGGSRRYVERLIRDNAINEVRRTCSTSNSKRRIDVCDCILHASIVHL